eukprot:187260-Pyramimonas_sp.AAC.1
MKKFRAGAGVLSKEVSSGSAVSEKNARKSQAGAPFRTGGPGAQSDPQGFPCQKTGCEPRRKHLATDSPG